MTVMPMMSVSKLPTATVKTINYMDVTLVEGQLSKFDLFDQYSDKSGNNLAA